MDPFTIAGIVAIVLSGALSKGGEKALDGSLNQLSRLLKQRFPDTWHKINSASEDDIKALPEVIDAVATVIKKDEEVKKVAEEVATENQSKPEIINHMEKVGIVNQGGTIHNPTFNF